MEPTFADVAAMEFAVAGIGRDHEMRRSFAFLQRNRCGFAAMIAIFSEKRFLQCLFWLFRGDSRNSRADPVNTRFPSSSVIRDLVIPVGQTPRRRQQSDHAEVPNNRCQRPLALASFPERATSTGQSA
jgi:hypothetical protein